MLSEKIEILRRILDESKYTVALWGSGMMEEGGYLGIKKEDRAYEIEKKYGASPEYIFTSSYYNTRPDKFFEFYKSEMLYHSPQMTESALALAAMERAGKLQCIVNSNIYENLQKAGCTNVINIHGSVQKNKCPRCGREYSLEYIMNSEKVPVCETCNVPVRPQISLFGEMVDSQIMTHTTLEVEKAETLLLLGTTLDSDIYKNYIRYFGGNRLVVIHQRENYLDYKADLVIIDQPKNVLPLLGY